jgi:superfamily II DNA or RNA helicase
MLLRKRQQEFVAKCAANLKTEKNTLGIAPTGAGKTIMMAAVALEAAPKDLPSVILQHRDELVTQNRDKFVQFAGIRNIRRPMTINAQEKAWDRQGGGWNFAMAQTLIKNLPTMPKIGLLAIDEAHHCPAPTYIEIIKTAKAQNPDVLIYGTTATPNRGDRKALRTTFSNVGDQITIGELIQAGHLVRPRTFVLDIGVQGELNKVKRTAIDFDMKEVESVMNKSVLNDKIIEHWKEKAGDRQTIIFCSTVQHAADVTKAFQDHRISAEMVDGNMALGTRREILQRYDAGHLQVLVNVAVLTEGFDHQPTSCVILLRPSSWKSTMVQMIGRGLRKVDTEIYPGVVKDDCIVLDFGTSVLMHGNLEDEPCLHGSGTKDCPECQAKIPHSCRECAICGFEFENMFIPCPGCQLKVPSTAHKCKLCGYVINPRSSGGGGGDESGVLDNFVMSEIDILQDSPFKYESFYDGRVLICFGFNYWAAVVHFHDGRFYAIGAEANDPNARNFRLHCVASSDHYLVALQSADDFMRTKGNKADAKRVAQWLYETATDKQLELLGEGMSFGMTKYRASCAVQFKFYGNQIRGCIQGFLNATKEKTKIFA